MISVPWELQRELWQKTERHGQVCIWKVPLSRKRVTNPMAGWMGEGRRPGNHQTIQPVPYPGSVISNRDETPSAHLNPY